MMGFMDKDGMWKNVLGQLRLNVSEGTFNTFLKNLSLGSIRDVDAGRQLVEIYCPSSFIRDTVEQRFWGQIKTTLDSLTEKKNELVFGVKELPVTTNGDQKKTANKNEGSTLFDIKPEQSVKSSLSAKVGLKEFSTFETFAVSSSNQMAHAAAVAVADKPGNAYNPLFLWGGVGVGKTHLMQAVGNKLLTTNDEIKVIYCSGEEFTNDIVEGIKTKSMDKIREKYRKVNLLLLDDIQFIAGKEAVQEEFFHTFNAIQKVGGQIVLTSDRQPHEIAKLEDRLRSRFEAGLIVDISPPDFALRTAITLIKAEQKNLPVDTSMAQLIANHADSARKIEGVLVKLITYKDVRGELNMEMVMEAMNVKDEEQTQTKIITPNAVLEMIARKYEVSVGQIKGSRRMSSIVEPRMVAMYILRIDLALPFDEVGRVVGGRDHSTVMHAVRKVDLEMEENNKVRHMIAEVRKEVFGETVNITK